ncbi:MAG: lysophospholipase [Clostridiaceae bacterium]
MFDEKMVVSFDGVELRMRKDLIPEPKALVIIVHGLNEHLNRYDHFTEKLNESGYSVYRFDQRGHGKSKGERVFFGSFHEMPDDTNVIVDLAREESVGKKIFLFGHSMGGETVALYGTKYPGKTDGIITSGALTRYNLQLFGDQFPIEATAKIFVPNSLGEGVCSDPAVIEAHANDPLVEKEISIGLLNETYKGVQYLKTNSKAFTDPVLILHGAKDGLVSEKDSRDFFGDISSSDKSLRIYGNLLHEILNEPRKEEVIADIVLWLNKHL